MHANEREFKKKILASIGVHSRMIGLMSLVQACSLNLNSNESQSARLNQRTNGHKRNLSDGVHRKNIHLPCLRGMTLDLLLGTKIALPMRSVHLAGFSSGIPMLREGILISENNFM